MKLIIVGLCLFLSGCFKPPFKQQIIEINSIPPPFNINGRFPYVVWMNGKRVDMPQKDILALIKKIGKENIKPSNNKDIHIGWLIPHTKLAKTQK